MWLVLWRNPMAVLLALLLHIGLAVLLLVSMDWQTKPKPQDAPVVQARLVEQVVEQKAEKPQPEKPDPVQEKRKKEEADRKAEEKRKKEEAERKAEEKREKEEANRKAEEKRKKEEAERKAEEKRKKEEANRKAEEKRKKEEAERKAEEKRKKEEAEEKRKKEAAARKAAEKAEREQELLAQYQAEQATAEASRITRLIQQKVARHWNRPPGTAELGLKCRIKVRLGASGSVLSVAVIQSSGHAAFDRSVEAAVWKADPLPMPDDEKLRANPNFRQHEFIFDPV